MINKEEVIESLKSIADIGGRGDIVSGGRVKDVSINDASIRLTLDLPTDDQNQRARIEDRCREAIQNIDGTSGLMVMIGIHKPEDPAAGPERASQRLTTGSPFDMQAPIPGIRNIIAVASGKGGVGKSTVCVNLALALQKRGFRIGLLDADVYGPSLHVLLGVSEHPQPGKQKEIAPVEYDGMKLMSIGFILERGTPVIWRGPIVQGIVKKFLQDVEWGELDYLLIDLPPGTGDAQLTLVQTVPLTTAIIVTTPSELALVDAEKGLNMFTHVNVPVLGIIENMSYFICPHCGEQTDVFDSGGGKEISKKLSVEFLGEIPLDGHIRAGGDRGEPIVKIDPESPISQSFIGVAERVVLRCPVGVEGRGA
ncbi:MAG: P-loop NTPase [Candidatus Latescibacteria bacterium]|nr:P-loop NTPase [Candidatus Latescibacterota bacterium]NIM64522.1 P-loop NTPase [Candidatus Latescibacterota bacterium]NIO00675.1 P-loop NTPase [Candidatus Latescibacterota bacterium]NIO27078.1 P-loop NTPase [Candidatus Latescibacterota bacterium]NIO54602.1 P-loop NTPase [Candidatus Latescibacterota bacterium]